MPGRRLFLEKFAHLCWCVMGLVVVFAVESARSLRVVKMKGLREAGMIVETGTTSFGSHCLVLIRLERHPSDLLTCFDFYMRLHCWREDHRRARHIVMMCGKLGCQSHTVVPFVFPFKIGKSGIKAET